LTENPLAMDFRRFVRLTEREFFSRAVQRALGDGGSTATNVPGWVALPPLPFNISLEILTSEFASEDAMCAFSAKHGFLAVPFPLSPSCGDLLSPPLHFHWRTVAWLFPSLGYLFDEFARTGHSVISASLAPPSHTGNPPSVLLFPSRVVAVPSKGLLGVHSRINFFFSALP